MGSRGEHEERVLRVPGRGAPGVVAPPIDASTTKDEELGRLEDSVPLHRVAQAVDVADVAVFLRSGKAATTVVVDGGIMQGSVGL
jgi:glucose 1-dehydrogenase